MERKINLFYMPLPYPIYLCQNLVPSICIAFFITFTYLFQEGKKVSKSYKSSQTFHCDICQQFSTNWTGKFR